ncbi:hypothetical protein PAGU2595_001160 [Lysobacter xanthus]
MLGTWAGPVVTLAGFVLVRNQLRAERRALETQTSWQMYETSISILTVFVEHPEIRPYFYDGRPAPTEEPLRSRVLATAELVADHMESVVLSQDAVEAGTRAVWVRYMQGIYRRSPVLRAFLAHDSEGYRYADRFLDLLREPFMPGVPAMVAPIDEPA